MTPDSIPDYMAIPQGVRNASSSDSVYQLYSCIINTARHIRSSEREEYCKQVRTVLLNFRPSLENHSVAERAEKWWQLAKTEWLNPVQVVRNITSPIDHWLHTGHAMYELESGSYRVDHYKFRELVTVDIVRPNEKGNYLGKGRSYRWKRFERLERIVLDDLEGYERLGEVMAQLHPAISKAI